MVDGAVLHRHAGAQEDEPVRTVRGGKGEGRGALLDVSLHELGPAGAATPVLAAITQIEALAERRREDALPLPALEDMLEGKDPDPHIAHNDFIGSLIS
jgi:hypothetical protein